MSDRLELVSRFETLRAGEPLAFLCGWCGDLHRQVLLRLEVAVNDDGAYAIAKCEPGITCGPRPPERLLPWGFTADAVANRRVFRFVDGLPSALGEATEGSVGKGQGPNPAALPGGPR